MSDPPTVESVLSWAREVGPLNRPVLVVAMTGWFDASGVATTAVEHLVPDGEATTIADIDPDPFYDFTQERPTVFIDDAEVRTIVWPRTDVRLVRTGGGHDLLVIVVAEPHLSWATYVACLRRLVDEYGCEAVVTVGSIVDAVPHTRLPLVVGSTSDPEVAARLGLASPSYQGVTGLIGVINAQLGEARPTGAGIPVISLRVGVPHYLAPAEHPRAVAALLTHLSHVLGLTRPVDLSEAIDQWAGRHDELVAEDPQLRAYVHMLETQYDQRAAETLATGEDLAARFEEFLRGERDDESGAP